MTEDATSPSRRDRHPEPKDDEDKQDPRLKEPGSAGMPVETIDTPHNMPGDQDDPPKRRPDA